MYDVAINKRHPSTLKHSAYTNVRTIHIGVSDVPIDTETSGVEARFYKSGCPHSNLINIYAQFKNPFPTKSPARVHRISCTHRISFNLLCSFFCSPIRHLTCSLYGPSRSICSALRSLRSTKRFAPHIFPIRNPFLPTKT